MCYFLSKNVQKKDISLAEAVIKEFKIEQLIT